MPSEALVRVSDAEREAVVTTLAEHYAAGRLSLPRNGKGACTVGMAQAMAARRLRMQHA